MKKIFKASTIISLLLSLFICLPAQLHSYDFDRYRSDDSFNLPSFRFQDFQKELNQQKGIFSSTFNAYQNFNDNNVSRNLFGFDVTDPVSVAANFEVQKELVSLPQAGVSIDIANISGKQFYLPEASKKPAVIETQSARGAELFTQQFSGPEIKTDNAAAAISSEKDIVPNWFKPGKSIFEPTQSAQVSGQDVEQVKNKINERAAVLTQNGPTEISLPFGSSQQIADNFSISDKSKITDIAPQLQRTTSFTSQNTNQNLEKDLAQVIPITPLKPIKSDPAIMPGESWEKAKATVAFEPPKTKQGSPIAIKGEAISSPVEKIDNKKALEEAEKKFIDNGLRSYESHLEHYAIDEGASAAKDLAKIVDHIRASDNKEEAKKYLADKLNLTGKRREMWMDFTILVMPANREAVTEKEYGLIYDTVSKIPSDMRDHLKVFMTIDKPPVEISGGAKLFTGGWMWSKKDMLGVICINDIKYRDEEGYAKVIFHETGHMLEYSGYLTEGQLEQWEKLWGLSDHSAGERDFARSYPSDSGKVVPNRQEDFATMCEAYGGHTQFIVARAKLNAKLGSDILLQKIEFIADLYKHTGKDGKAYTYVFEVIQDPTSKKFMVERKEVPLAEQVIGEKKYMLPLLTPKMPPIGRKAPSAKIYVIDKILTT